MAIKFGDTLENQNSAYPIVDASGNNLKGVIFSTGLPGSGDFPNKRANGAILIDTSNDKVYVYQNSDTGDTPWSTATNWEQIGKASDVFQTSNISYSIGSNTFGTLSGSGTITASAATPKTALQIINEVLVSYQAPTLAFDAAAQTAIQYDTADQSGLARTISFDVTNNNQAVISGSNYQISKVRLLRRKSSGSYAPVASTAAADSLPFTTDVLSTINTVGTATAATFTFDDTLSTNGGDDSYFRYKIEVTPRDGDGTELTAVTVEGVQGNNGNVDIQSYNAPQLSTDSFTRQDVSSHFVAGSSGNQGTETAVRREKGNVATKLNFVIDNDSPLVPVTSFVVKRSIDGDTPVTIYSATSLSIVGNSSEYKIFDSIASTTGNVTGLNNVPENYTVVTSAFPTTSTDCDTVEYTVEITDDQGTTTDSLNTGEINFEFPGLIGYGTTDCDGFDANDNSTMTGLLHAIRDTSGLRAQYEIISTADDLSGEDADFGVVALATTSSQFVYIGYPADLDEIDTVNDPGGTPSYGAFGSAPKSTTVPFTTDYGVAGTYEFYASNSSGAFSGNYTIN